MTARRTPQHEAVLALRLAAIEAGVTLLDTDPDLLPPALADARRELEGRWAKAVKVGVGS